MWSFGAIEPRSLIAIASEGNANEKLWFLWRHVKIQKCKSCIINHIPRLKCLIFLCWDLIPRTCHVFTRLFTSNTPWYFLDFTLSRIMQNSWKGWTWDQNIDSYEEISFLVKNTVFIKNENEFLKNSDFWYTWSYDHIQQVFKISDRSDQYSRRYGILNSYPFWNSIMLYRFYTK